MADQLPPTRLAERHVEKRIATIDVQPLNTQTGSKLVVLRIYHATGVTVVPVMAEYARTVARELLEAAGGITLASSVPQPPPNGKKV